MLSPHPADPTLTTDNLMEVVKEVEHRWRDLSLKLGLPFYGLSGMAEVVDEYVRRYPTPSWKQVATVLQEMKLDKLADEVTTKYVRGMDVNHVHILDTEIKLSVKLMWGMRFWRTCRSGTHIVGMYDKILTSILRIDVDMTSL